MGPDRNCDFESLVKEDYYVDKTLFLKKIFETKNNQILITAPIGFGKTINLQMLKKFLEIPIDQDGNSLIRGPKRENETINEFVKRQIKHMKNIEHRNRIKSYEIFGNLIISQTDSLQYMANFPVVYINLKIFSHIAEDYQTVKYKVCEVLHKLFKEHEYLLKSTQLSSEDIDILKKYYDEEMYKELNREEIDDGFVLLIENLYYHFHRRKVVVLIDDYDCGISTIDAVVDIYLFRELLKNLYNFDEYHWYIEKMIFTGVHYIWQYFQSGNELEKCEFLDPHKFSTLNGLTEFEFNQLFDRFEIDSKFISRIRNHYEGYVTKSGIKLYRTESIVNCLKSNGIPEINSRPIIRFIQNLIYLPIMRYILEKLCLNNNFLTYISNVYIRQTDWINLFHFLIEQGCLTFVDLTKECAVKIANIEIKNEFEKQLLVYYSRRNYDKFYSELEECAQHLSKIQDSNCHSDEIYLNFFTEFKKLVKKLIDLEIIENVLDQDTFFEYLMFTMLCKSNYQIRYESCCQKDLPLIFYKEHLGINVKINDTNNSADGLSEIQEEIKFFRLSPTVEIVEKIYFGLNINQKNTFDLKIVISSNGLLDRKCYFA